MTHGAVFVDRDGTLNDVACLSSPGALDVFPQVPEAVCRLNRSGLKVILVTNQSGIARHVLSFEDLDAMHKKLQASLSRSHAWLDDVLVCPHRHADGCRCRKPGPGMIEQATSRHAIDVSKSYVVGDQSNDVELAHRVGAKGILVMTGPRSRESLAVCRMKRIVIDCVALDFAGAVSWILRDWTTASPAGPRRRGA